MFQEERIKRKQAKQKDEDDNSSDEEVSSVLQVLGMLVSDVTRPLCLTYYQI